MEEDEIREIARIMLRQYGELAVRLMETRARNCARYGEPDSAAFWQSVGEEVSKLAASAEAVVIGREALRRTKIGALMPLKLADVTRTNPAASGAV